jgi:hypothetical protein
MNQEQERPRPLSQLLNPEAVRLDVLMLPRMLHVGLALVFR